MWKLFKKSHQNATPVGAIKSLIKTLLKANLASFKRDWLTITSASFQSSCFPVMRASTIQRMRRSFPTDDVSKVMPDLIQSRQAYNCVTKISASKGVVLSIGLEHSNNNA
jgi:hypothetical protein